MQKFLVLIIGSLILAICGCGYHGVKHESGRPIDENLVRKIENGKTTSDEILAMFGAPTTTSEIAQDKIFVYKYCKNKGGSFSIAVVGSLGSTSTKEVCDELSIIFDSSTGKVKSHGFQKRLDD